MKKILLLIAILLLFNQTGQAQIERQILALASGDSVALILTVPPLSTESFHVYRQGPLPENDDYVLLTSGEPVKPVIDASRVRAVLGEDWQTMTELFGTEQPFELMRKLRSDDFIGLVHSLYSSRVAQLTGRWYLDEGVEKGKRYNYRIVIVNSSGKEKEVVEKKITVVDKIPVAPTQLKGETGDGEVKLTWEYPKWSGDYSDLAIQYYVLRKKGDTDYEKANHKPIIRDDLVSPSFTDRWLENGVSYTYAIVAVDPLRRQSPLSSEIIITPADNKAPARLKNLNASSGDGFITISWDMSLELDVDGYNLYRSEGLRDDYIKINESLISLELPVYTDSSISNGIQYFYCVTAIDKSKNESEKSNAITALGEDRTPPDPPTNLKFSIAERVLTLTWSPSAAKDLSGYYVYRGMSEDIQPKIIHEPYMDTVFVDKGYQAEGMTPGKSFWVSVSAVDKSRNESEKLTMIIEIPDDVPPLPPQGFFAENVKGRFVKISSSASASMDVAKYRVIRNDTQIAEFGSAPIAYRDSSVEKGQEYIYYCVAVDSANNQSEFSKIDTVRVKDNSPPPSPRNVSAKKTETGIQLKWERVVDFDLIGYNVYRASIPSGVYTRLNDQPLALENREFLDSSGDDTNYYKVKALDTSGNESTRSEAVHAK